MKLINGIYTPDLVSGRTRYNVSEPNIVSLSGIRGKQGVPGPNQITEETATNLTGFLYGDGEKVLALDSEPSPSPVSGDYLPITGGTLTGSLQLGRPGEGDSVEILFDRADTKIGVGMGFHIRSGEGIVLEAPDLTDPDNIIEYTVALANGNFYLNGNKIFLNNGSFLDAGGGNNGADGGIALICAIGYEFKWEAGSLYIQSIGGNVRVTNYQFGQPSQNHDVTKGFMVDSKWTTDYGISYVCMDNSEGSAVWRILPYIASGDNESGLIENSSVVGLGNIATGVGASAVGYENEASGVRSSSFGYQNTASGNDSSAFGNGITTTTDGTTEIGYRAEGRRGTIRMHSTGMVSSTIQDKATEYGDGGETLGSEADDTLGRGMFSIRRDGLRFFMDYNDGGTIRSISLGTANNSGSIIDSGGDGLTRIFQVLAPSDYSQASFLFRSAHPDSSFLCEISADPNDINIQSANVTLDGQGYSVANANAFRDAIQTSLYFGELNVADLPTASDFRGARAFVLDSDDAFSSASLGIVVVGSGSNYVPVFSNGVDWIVG